MTARRFWIERDEDGFFLLKEHGTVDDEAMDDVTWKRLDAIEAFIVEQEQYASALRAALEAFKASEGA